VVSHIKYTDYLPQFLNNIDRIEIKNNYLSLEIERFLHNLKKKDINSFNNLLINQLTPKTVNMLENARLLPPIDDIYLSTYLYIPKNLSYTQKLLLGEKQKKLVESYLEAKKEKNEEKANEIYDRLENPYLSDMPLESEDEQKKISSSIIYRLIKLSNKIDIFQSEISDKIDILLKL